MNDYRIAKSPVKYIGPSGREPIYVIFDDKFVHVLNFPEDRKEHYAKSVALYMSGNPKYEVQIRNHSPYSDDGVTIRYNKTGGSLWVSRGLVDMTDFWELHDSIR